MNHYPEQIKRQQSEPMAVYPGAGHAVGGLVGLAIDPEKTPQLAQVSERLHVCIQELDSTLGVLEKRLDGVLNPVAPERSVGEGVTALRPVRCPLGQAMDARSDEVYSITCRVRGLLDRLAT